MASIPRSNDCLSTSTPIQQGSIRCKNENCQTCFLNLWGGKVDVISPIKKKTLPLRRNLFDSFNDSGYSDVSDNHAKNVKNNILTRIKRNSKFSALSENINILKTNSHKDSGIYSETHSFSFEKPSSMFDRLKYFSTDENGNVIGSYDVDNSSYIFNESYYSTKFHDYQSKSSKTGKLYTVLDNRIKVISSSQNDIKYKYNIPNFDLLRELNLRNCSAVLSLILSNLDDEDLRQASYISREWKSIVYHDKRANERRKAYIQKKRDIATGSQKENRFHVKPAIERNHKSAFLSVVNSPAKVVKSLNFSPIVGRFDSFIQEVQNLQKYDELMKCPICCFPSKNESGNKYCCSRNLCQHAFCKKCFGPYLDNHSCSMPKLNATVPNITIGSKKSKKNLRRL